MWRARVVDVMNPMGVLVAPQIMTASSARFHSSGRDALFLSAWKSAIEPDCHVTLNFNSRVVLQEGLKRVIELAESVIHRSGNQGDNALVGSLRNRSTLGAKPCHDCSGECVEQKLREEVLYFFGTLSGLSSRLSSADKIRSFEYLAAVVAQKDELFPMLVGEHLGYQMRSNFEFLCSLHYFESNARQTGRIKRLMEIEHQLQELCTRIPLLPQENQQTACFQIEYPLRKNHPTASSAVAFLPSALPSNDFSKRDLLLEKIDSYLNLGIENFLFVDSFHQRVRWMERLSQVRQSEQLEQLRRDPLRAQAIMDSRSGRQKIIIVSPDTQQFLLSVTKMKLFMELSIPMQETIQTALELDVVRQQGQWGPPPHFDFVSLVEALAVQSHKIDSKRIVHTFTDPALRRFLDATLNHQEIDSGQCYKMLMD